MLYNNKNKVWTKHIFTVTLIMSFFQLFAQSNREQEQKKLNKQVNAILDLPEQKEMDQQKGNNSSITMRNQFFNIHKDYLILNYLHRQYFIEVRSDGGLLFFASTDKYSHIDFGHASYSSIEKISSDVSKLIYKFPKDEGMTYNHSEDPESFDERLELPFYIPTAKISEFKMLMEQIIKFAKNKNK